MPALDQSAAQQEREVIDQSAFEADLRAAVDLESRRPSNRTKPIQETHRRYLLATREKITQLSAERDFRISKVIDGLKATRNSRLEAIAALTRENEKSDVEAEKEIEAINLKINSDITSLQEIEAGTLAYLDAVEKFNG
jgi:hypothetical protein